MTEENNVIIGKNIRNARLLKGITMDELINILRVNYGFSITQPTLSKYENGVVKNIPEEILAKIASALDVSIEYLLNNTQFKSEDNNSKIIIKLINNTKDKQIKWNNLMFTEYLENNQKIIIEKHKLLFVKRGTSLLPLIDFNKSYFTSRGEYYFYIITSNDNYGFSKLSFFVFSTNDSELLIELTNSKNYTGDLYKLIKNLYDTITEPTKSKEEKIKENILDLLDEVCFNRRS